MRAASQGTVTLVALCFVTVLGIVLGSYLAVCSRAMNLANRGFQQDLAQQLAELGIEEGLRAFNKNDWADWSNGISVDWNTTTYAASKRAIATVTFPAGKFGQGTTATVKIRVDNYDARVVGSSWSNSADYEANDLVGRNGIWYRAAKENLNATPNNISNLDDWIPAPIPWQWTSNVTYRQYDVVNRNGVWYRYHSATPSTNGPPNGTYWTVIGAIYGSYSGSTYYNLNDIVYYGAPYQWITCTDAGWGGDAWDYAAISWRWMNTRTYAVGDVVYQGGVWYRCVASSTNNSPPNTTYWENALGGSVSSWVSGVDYNLGDAVYYGTNNQWYRCVLAHTSSGSILPDNTAYWANTPAYSSAWDSGKEYSTNDVVHYNGIWYLCINGGDSTVGANPSTASTYWIGANTTNTSYIWSTGSHSSGSYRCYGGVWYRCTASATSQSPNDTGYWTAAWSNGFGVTTGAPVIYAEATIAIGGNRSSVVQLRAPIAPAALFPNAVGATSDITITTATGRVDSFDSSVGSYSSQSSSATTNHSAVLAAATSLSILGTTEVRGYVAYPNPPTNLSVGTTVKSYTSSASPNVDPSRVSRSAYVPVFDPLPRGGLLTAFSDDDFPKGSLITATATLNLGTPGAVAPSRYYFNSDLQTGSSETINTININGPVILYINGSLRMRSGGVIYVNSTGSAEIHVANRLIFESGTNGIVNRSPTTSAPNPKNLVIIADTSTNNVQSLSYRDLAGVIYMPYTTNASGLQVGTGIAVYGALSASEVTFSSEATVHYDTSLRHATIPGVDQPYGVTQWRVLPQTEQATMP
jgi:hypothetical protein